MGWRIGGRAGVAYNIGVSLTPSISHKKEKIEMEEK